MIMDIVVKLPGTNITEDIIRAAKWEDGSLFDMVLRGAMKNAIILPKGHGRLGDLDILREEVSSWGMNDYEPSDFIDEIDRADTIIEADKAENEDKK